VNENLVVMGVAGCGKSTIGFKLAKQLGMPFLDADNFHSDLNLKKMSSGLALEDADRLPWLQILKDELNARSGCVLACSALKKEYRSILGGCRLPTRFLLLQISKAIARSRMAGREGHFMPQSLLESQFDTLEITDDLIVIDAETSEDTVLSSIAMNL